MQSGNFHNNANNKSCSSWLLIFPFLFNFKLKFKFNFEFKSSSVELLKFDGQQKEKGKVDLALEQHWKEDFSFHLNRSGDVWSNKSEHDFH